MSQDTAAVSGTPVVVVEETPAYSLVARLAAETFGTFLLVLGIVGTAALNFVNQNSIIPIALAGGIMLMAGFAAVGHISGGHFNPAVTFGMALAGRTTWRDLLPYWAAQLVGAVVAALVVWAIIPQSLPEAMGSEGKGSLLQSAANGFGEHSPLSTLSQGATEFGVWAALLVEIIIAAVFVGIFFGATDKRVRLPYAAVVIGLTLAALHLVSWPVTNTSFNPARSFAAAVFGGGWTWGQLWLFIVAPLVGGALAALFYRAFSPVEVAEEYDEGYVDEADEELEPADDELTFPEVAEADVAEPAKPAAAVEAEGGKPEEPEAPKA
jgi:aquaporin Z